MDSNEREDGEKLDGESGALFVRLGTLGFKNRQECLYHVSAFFRFFADLAEGGA